MASWPNLSRVSQKFHQLSHLRTTLAPMLQPQRPRPQGPRAELGRALGYMALDPPQSAVEHLPGLAEILCLRQRIPAVGVVHGIPFLPKPTGMGRDHGRGWQFFERPDLLLYWLYGSKWSDSQIGPWPLPQHLAVGQENDKTSPTLPPTGTLANIKTCKIWQTGVYASKFNGLV